MLQGNVYERIRQRQPGQYQHHKPIQRWQLESRIGRPGQRGPIYELPGQGHQGQSQQTGADQGEINGPPGLRPVIGPPGPATTGQHHHGHGGDAGQKHGRWVDGRRGHADHQAGGRDDAVVGTQHRGAQPADALREVSFMMPAHIRFHGSSSEIGTLERLPHLLDRHRGAHQQRSVTPMERMPASRSRILDASFRPASRAAAKWK